MMVFLDSELGRKSTECIRGTALGFKCQFVRGTLSWFTCNAVCILRWGKANPYRAVARQEQRFFHPLGEASKLENKPKLATQFLGQSFPIAFAKHSRSTTDIASSNLRGALTTAAQLMVGIGVSVAFIAGTVLTWRVLELTGLIPCVILLVGLSLFPESPRWLAKKGREKEFESTLQKLRGKAVDSSSYEAAEIKDHIETLERLPKAKLLDFSKKTPALNNWEEPTHSAFMPAIPLSQQVVVVAFSTTKIDRIGGKPLLQVSAFGLVLSCIITGLSFYLKVQFMVLEMYTGVRTLTPPFHPQLLPYRSQKASIFYPIEELNRDCSCSQNAFSVNPLLEVAIQGLACCLVSLSELRRHGRSSMLLWIVMERRPIKLAGA
ncbi:hypothetical protein POTOM_048462 [Populus tomentosa]|uniref:Uncharacterized protein n=1 Tax=Populus tomentosa TaxID=118781 RepID=A0A8X8CAL9_POPTO|nr:hypothetical protein POTOM_048462 [Populus tomentosa]